VLNNGRRRLRRLCARRLLERRTLPAEALEQLAEAPLDLATIEAELGKAVGMRGLVAAGALFLGVQYRGELGADAQPSSA